MPDYANWVLAADAGTFGFVDYVHAQVLRGGITADVLGAIVGWLWPEFVEEDGSIILASSTDKFLRLKSQGLPDIEIEYWCNFTNIDGILPGLPVSFGAYLAGVIRDMWCAKLHNDFPGKKFVVEVVELLEQNEFSVTFRQHEGDS
ncbi:hypothetical protein HH299_06665 [Xanthomonas sp. Kuri4-2]